MSKIRKFYERLCSKPTPVDIKLEELISFLKNIGFKIKSGGKHLIVNYEDFVFPIPRDRNVKKGYILEIAKKIKEYGFEDIIYGRE